MNSKSNEIKRDETNYGDLGKRVRAARQRAGLTQEMLAEQVGISASFLGHIERGTRIASIGTLVALCNVLNITPEYFLRASLTIYNADYPADLTPQQQNRLRELQDTITDTFRKWNQD